MRVYVVWEAMLASDDSVAASRRAAEADDSRLVHFWDPERLTGSAWRYVLGLTRQAWDVYFVYSPRAVWGDLPPHPDYWQHQGVGTDRAPILDRAELLKSVRSFLSEQEPHE